MGLENSKIPDKKEKYKRSARIRDFWCNRKAFAEKRNARTDAYSFLPGVLEVTDRPPHPLLKVMLYCLIFLIVFVVIWAYFSRIDIIVNPIVI